MFCFEKFHARIGECSLFDEELDLRVARQKAKAMTRDLDTPYGRGNDAFAMVRYIAKVWSCLSGSDWPSFCAFRIMRNGRLSRDSFKTTKEAMKALNSMVFDIYRLTAIDYDKVAEEAASFLAANEPNLFLADFLWEMDPEYRDGKIDLYDLFRRIIPLCARKVNFDTECDYWAALFLERKWGYEHTTFESGSVKFELVATFLESEIVNTAPEMDTQRPDDYGEASA